jgi:circadian clock protein KaiB
VCIQYTLKLFVTGRSPRSTHAFSTLQRICDARLKGRYTIDLIDLQEFPELGPLNDVLVTPTVIKELPLPQRRVVGDLTHEESVASGLGLVPSLLDAQELGT